MATGNKYDCLKLENQICFPLYACAKEVVRQYRPYLSEIGLTYTQYIVMLVLWEHGSMTEKAIGERIRLDSGTLAPLLRRMEKQGFISRKRTAGDERTLTVALTETGEALKKKAVEIPEKMASCLGLEQDEAEKMYVLLYRLLETMSKNS